MATIQSRPFSKNYSGLVNQRKRRGKRYRKEDGLGSVETWEFGYLFQGRSWARNPSPPLPLGWPLGWVKQVLTFPEDRFNELRGVDASVYIRFLKGCFWFSMAHTLTTLPILLPIHVRFSDGSVSPTSMTRASISSLAATQKGLSLLWIHLLILIWVTGSWIFTLYWICLGAFNFRSQKIQEAADRAASDAEETKDAQYHPHPHPQYPFQTLPPLDPDHTNRGLRMRTVMVTNIPPGLRSEKDLKEYFEYYLSRPIAKPSVGVTSSTQPGFLNRTIAFLFNRAKQVPSKLQRTITSGRLGEQKQSSEVSHQECKPQTETPVIDRVVLVRKMSDLSSLLERREEVLRLLETAHIKLAKKTLAAVKEAMEAKPRNSFMRAAASRMSFAQRRSPASSEDVERGSQTSDGVPEGEDRMQLLIRTLGPYVPEDDSRPKRHGISSLFRFWQTPDVEMSTPFSSSSTSSSESAVSDEKTIWDALLSLPRSTLDTYQPLIHLSALFRGKTVPAIDYYTAKLNLLTSLITEKRAKAVGDYVPMSTAFVTFAVPADARRARKYLAVHPNNPLDACLVTMAPSYEDLDWIRLMKSTFRVEFVKDWVVNLGVWAFTIFWVFPVSIFVGLVSIQNISAFWPGLRHYLDNHQWEEELLQSFLPTLLVALLALLIPLILLLIAKKAHTISTLSALHDRIMTRYYKFLIVNVLVFFCVGTVALQSFLLSFKATTSLKLIEVVSDSFPTAGPFYVGWLIFSMAMHGGFELTLFGLPLILYPSTKRQITPRKRAVGIRPRTFNYYYWLPNHLLVIHVLLVFSVLNPLVIPFGFFYFCVETTVIRNQLLHVYARNYELNGRFILIRLIRYSLDGLILSQVVFLAYMVVLKKTANVAVSAILICFTAFVKMMLTRICRARYERDDMLEADIVCGTTPVQDETSLDPADLLQPSEEENERRHRTWKDTLSARAEFWTMRLAQKINFAYATSPARPQRNDRRQPNPFGPKSSMDSSAPLKQSTSTGISKLSSKASPTVEELSYPQLARSETSQDQQYASVPERSRTALVSRHPPHPAWDDNSSPDHAYENPYYTREISNALWLPRDPTQLLDLDDTVDLRMSLTSEPGAGKLGVWDNEEQFLETSLSSVFAASIGSLDEDLSYTPPVRQLDGSEIISLPSGIASRVEHIDREDDVETIRPQRRPSAMGRRTSSGTSTSSRPLSLRRPTTIDTGTSTQFRTFSLGTEPTSSSERPPSSYKSTSDRRRRNRAASVDCTMSLRPDMVPSNSVTSRGTSRSLLSVIERQVPIVVPNGQALGAPSIISTREAVVGEVIVEEQEAAQERLRQEEAEEKAREPRSLWTSWIFARRQ
ncbi:unnamed protein product [Somion occarium]|uniref:DUF221-domain-containing protein n=1 Tax=Somion occarium TaxID=3059160 RepID=A0ABP1DYG5_9APHY